MKSRVYAVALTALLGVTAPLTAAMALGYETDALPSTRFIPSDVDVTGSLGIPGAPRYTACPGSSASEGNAAQQNFPVKQYGQTSGGYRC